MEESTEKTTTSGGENKRLSMHCANAAEKAEEILKFEQNFYILLPSMCVKRKVSVF
jgi:hypothetical protein